MSSWLTTPRRPKKETKEKQLTFQTTESGFCTQFNMLLYSYIYANSKGTLLHMCDMPNAIGSRYPFLRNTFDLPKDIQLIDTPIPSSMSLHSNKSSLESELSTYSPSQLRDIAKSFFKLRPEVQIRLKERLTILKVPHIDCTLHLKSNKDTSDVQKILQAVGSIQSLVKPQTIETISSVVFTSSFTSTLTSTITQDQPSFTSSYTSTITQNPPSFTSTLNSTITQAPPSFISSYTSTIVQNPLSFISSYSSTLTSTLTEGVVSFTSTIASTMTQNPPTFTSTISSKVTQNPPSFISSYTSTITQNPTTFFSTLNSTITQNPLSFTSSFASTLTTNILSTVVYESKPTQTKSPTIFVMTDDYSLFEQFLKKADRGWTIFTLPSAKLLSGYDETTFNRLPSQQKNDLYTELLVELTLAQRSDAIITSFKSNVGKFLYLTAGDNTDVRSMDNEPFTLF
jgi:hypothetical protein